MKISVVMSVYNAGVYLEQAIQSVLNQTYQDFELIIIDDGSTDQTSQIIHSFSDQRLILLQNEGNIGLTRSLNRGIKESRGKYIARVDADDIAAPEMLQKMYQFMEASSQIVILGTSKLFIDSAGNAVREFKPPIDNIEIQRTLLTWNCLPHCGAIYRTDALNKIGLYDESIKFAQDYDLALRLSEPWDGANLPDLLYQYRWHDQMISIDKKEEQDMWGRRIKKSAIERRLLLGRDLLLHKSAKTELFKSKSRKWLSDRYTWWSMSVRGPGNFCYALKFLLMAFLLHPNNSNAWHFLLTAIRRKLSYGYNKQAS